MFSTRKLVVLVLLLKYQAKEKIQGLKTLSPPHKIQGWKERIHLMNKGNPHVKKAEINLYSLSKMCTSFLAI